MPPFFPFLFCFVLFVLELDQAGLELTEIPPASASQVLELQAPPPPGSLPFFLFIPSLPLSSFRSTENGTHSLVHARQVHYP